MPLSRSLTVCPSSRGRLTLSALSAPSVLSAAAHGPARLLAWTPNSANLFSAEVERAAENLAKGGKPFGGYPPSTPTAPAGGSRRESMPMMGAGPRPYPEQQGTSTRQTRTQSIH